jgi:hypothetical protein
MLVKKKRGQFYLITALIIAFFIVTITITTNYSKKKSFRELYDIGEELKTESEKIFDYGIYNKLNDSGMENLLTNFTKIYTKYQKNAKDLYFAFGDENYITIAGYVSPTDTRENVRKKIFLIIPSQNTIPISIIDDGVYTASKYSLNGHKEIILNIDKINYYFKLEGQYFYFIISQEIEEQYYIVSNDD